MKSMMRTKVVIGTVLGAVLAVAGCSGTPTEPGPVPSAQSLAASDLDRRPVASPPGLLVSVDWLAENRTRPNVVVLHVGALAAYNQGHVPGAWFVNLAALQSTRNGVPVELNPPEVLRSVLEAAGVTTSQHVVITGDGPLPAARAFFILEYLGHPSVHLLDGDRAAWQAAYGLSTAAAAADRPGRVVTPVRDERLVTVDWVKANRGNPRVELLDARPATDFAAGRIPGAASLPWTQLVESTAMPRLRPVPELRALFAQTGADASDEVVTYCTSGMMSSMSYFAARYLGYRVRLYDGSMLEWTALGLPLER